MKIDELIEQVKCGAVDMDECQFYQTAELMRAAAETIRLLWEIAQDSTNSKYKMQFDEWSGNT